MKRPVVGVPLVPAAASSVPALAESNDESTVETGEADLKQGRDTTASTEENLSVE